MKWNNFWNMKKLFAFSNVAHPVSEYLCSLKNQAELENIRHENIESDILNKLQQHRKNWHNPRYQRIEEQGNYNACKCQRNFCFNRISKYINISYSRMKIHLDIVGLNIEFDVKKCVKCLKVSLNAINNLINSVFVLHS